MQLNQGKFMANGQCGYVLKPSYMIDEMFSPDTAEIVSTSCPIILTIHVSIYSKAFFITFKNVQSNFFWY